MEQKTKISMFFRGGGYNLGAAISGARTVLNFFVEIYQGNEG